jgi:hypothetical protein
MSRSVPWATVPLVAAIAEGRSSAGIASHERDRPRRRREAPGGAGIERAPRAFEDGDAQDAGQAEAKDDQDRPADDTQGRQQIDQAGGEVRGGDAEHREDNGEAGDEGDGVTDGEPSVRAGGIGAGAGDRDRAELAQVGGHERQHAG